MRWLITTEATVPSVAGPCARVRVVVKKKRIEQYLTAQSETSALTLLAMSKSSRPRISLHWHFCHLPQDKWIGRLVLKSKHDLLLQSSLEILRY